MKSNVLSRRNASLRKVSRNLVVLDKLGECIFMNRKERKRKSNRVPTANESVNHYPNWWYRQRKIHGIPKEPSQLFLSSLADLDDGKAERLRKKKEE